MEKREGEIMMLKSSSSLPLRQCPDRPHRQGRLDGRRWTWMRQSPLLLAFSIFFYPAVSGLPTPFPLPLSVSSLLYT